MPKTGTGEFSFCEKPDSENFFFFLTQNSRFMENGNWRILVLWKTRIGEFFFFFLTQNSRFVENGNWRILVLWKTRIGEFFFFFIREFSFRGNGEFSFCGKRELENSRFVKNQNRRNFFSFFFFLTQNSRFVENGNWRILVLWKTRIGEFFFFFNPEFSFCGNGEFSFRGKWELENSRFVKNQNRRIFFFLF